MCISIEYFSWFWILKIKRLKYVYIPIHEFRMLYFLWLNSYRMTSDYTIVIMKFTVAFLFLICITIQVSYKIIYCKDRYIIRVHFFCLIVVFVHHNFICKNIFMVLDMSTLNITKPKYWTFLIDCTIRRNTSNKWSYSNNNYTRYIQNYWKCEA